MQCIITSTWDSLAVAHFVCGTNKITHFQWHHSPYTVAVYYSCGNKTVEMLHGLLSVCVCEREIFVLFLLFMHIVRSQALKPVCSHVTAHFTLCIVGTIVYFFTTITPHKVKTLNQFLCDIQTLICKVQLQRRSNWSHWDALLSCNMKHIFPIQLSGHHLSFCQYVVLSFPDFILFIGLVKYLDSAWLSLDFALTLDVPLDSSVGFGLSACFLAPVWTPHLVPSAWPQSKIVSCCCLNKQFYYIYPSA